MNFIFIIILFNDKLYILYVIVIIEFICFSVMLEEINLL